MSQGAPKRSLKPILGFEGLKFSSLHPLVEWEGTTVRREASDVTPFVSR